MMGMAATKEKPAAAASGKEKRSANGRFEFRWVDRPAEPSPQTRSYHRSHADPTADAAIGNILREEKRRKRAQARRRKRKKNGSREGQDAGSGC